MSIEIAQENEFKHQLVAARQLKRMSQLTLSLISGVSQRHISCLETGKSQVTQPTVRKLAMAMELSLRETNLLLSSAGFQPDYNETGLDDTSMAPIRMALERMMAHHEPMPAFVLDKMWDIQLMNEPAKQLLSICLNIPNSELLRRRLNLLELSLSDEGLKPYIINFAQIAPLFLQRLKMQAFALGTESALKQFDAYQSMLAEYAQPARGALAPVIPIELEKDGISLSFFTVISTFGTPQDITTDELRVEAFYATNTETENAMQTLLGV